MRYLGLALFIAVFPLAGCPQPADPMAPGGPAPDGVGPPPGAGPNGAGPNGAPDGTGAPGPADGSPSADGAAPADGAGAPPPDANAAPFQAPGFASLIEGGATVTITGTIVGLKEAQVDFVAVREENGESYPDVLEILKTTDGTFTVTAPATYARPIYVTAFEITGDAPKATDRGGAVTAPITLAGKDVAVEIVVGKDASYHERLPWYRGGQDAPPPPAAPASPAGASAGGAPMDGAPPPDGAAPGGAPPPAAPQ